MLGVGLYNYYFWERKILTLYFLWGTSIIGLDFDIGSRFEHSIRERRHRESSFKNNSNTGEKNTKGHQQQTFSVCVPNNKLIFFQS